MIHACPSCGKSNRIPAGRLAETARCGQCKAKLSPLQAPVHVHSEAEFAELIEGSVLPVLVDFWADWCGPCKSIAPELAKLAGSHAGRVVVAKVDTEELPGLSSRFGIRGIPTLVLFRDGREAHRVSGAMNASAIAESFGL
jgi:thioredoxin 2